jgi:hypothetical protein
MNRRFGNLANGAMVFLGNPSWRLTQTPSSLGGPLRRGDLHALVGIHTLNSPICMLWMLSAHVSKEIDTRSKEICTLRGTG